MPAVNIYVIQVFWLIGEIKIGLTPTEFSAGKIVFPDITVKRFLQNPFSYTIAHLYGLK